MKALFGHKSQSPQFGSRCFVEDLLRKAVELLDRVAIPSVRVSVFRLVYTLAFIAISPQELARRNPLSSGLGVSSAQLATLSGKLDQLRRNPLSSGLGVSSRHPR